MVAHRKGQFTPKYRYTDDLIDEIEHAGLDWPGVQAEFGKSKHCITMALLRRGEPGRKALDGLQARTYGVVGQANIVSKVNKKGLGR